MVRTSLGITSNMYESDPQINSKGQEHACCQIAFMYLWVFHDKQYMLIVAMYVLCLYHNNIYFDTWKSKSSDSSWDTGSGPGHITGEGRKKPQLRPLRPPFPATAEAEWRSGSTDEKGKKACVAAIGC